LNSQCVFFKCPRHLIRNSDEAKYRQAVGVHPLVIKGEEVRIVHSYKYLGTVIDDKPEWTPNIEACCKKASQRLFFLRKLRQFRVNSTILNLFFQSTVQSMLLYNQLCFYGAAKKEDREQMDKIVKAASALIGQDVTPLADIYHRASAKKARAILDDVSHLLHPSLAACSSLRDSRLYSMRCRTSRFRDSFLPSAIRTLNDRSR
jgi:hypothetical protein